MGFMLSWILYLSTIAIHLLKTTLTNADHTVKIIAKFTKYLLWSYGHGRAMRKMDKHSLYEKKSGYKKLHPN